MSRTICIIAHRLLFKRRLVIFILFILRRIGGESSSYWTYTLNSRRFETTTWKAETASTCANTFTRKERHFFICLFSPACYFHFINYQTVRILRMILLMNGFDMISSWIEQFYWRYSRHALFALSCLHQSGAKQISHFYICSEIFKVLNLRKICGIYNKFYVRRIPNSNFLSNRYNWSKYSMIFINFFHHSWIFYNYRVFYHGKSFSQ